MVSKSANPTNPTDPNSFVQKPHNLLLIPGPIEVSDPVLYANAHPSVSHMSLDFGKVFGDCIRMTRQLLYSQTAQPFLVAGSGTLGWDMVASNLLSDGDEVLLLNTGFFGDCFADCLSVYTSPERVHQLPAPKVGHRPSMAALEEKLKERKYKMVCFTHVDTSTAVLSSPKEIGETVKRVSPDTLVVLDGVCSVASEEIRMDDWNIDVVLTASQKAISIPPGLAIVVVSQRALDIANKVKLGEKPSRAYFTDMRRWLPIHKAYESGSVAYFATPPVQLIYAFHASLTAILAGGLEKRFAIHKEKSAWLKAQIANLGLKQVAEQPQDQSNSMTAIYTPEGVETPQIIGGLLKKGVVIAAGIHSEIKTKYFRIGHMGTSVVDEGRTDLQDVITALSEVLSELGVKKSKRSKL
ncbi:PLP-dependent transferase [Atractiella rhizophila]|nr:PLP-dependent transferase [Atractiella rhizophila]